MMTEFDYPVQTNLPLKYTRSQQYQQIRKLHNGIKDELDVPESFKTFAEDCFIRSGTGIIPFKLYPYQEKLAAIIDAYRGVVVLKTRQMGVTELVPCMFFHKACLNPGYQAAVISMGQKETSEVARRCRRFPVAMDNIEFDTDSLTSLSIVDGGGIYFANTKKALRGTPSIADLLVDEAGFIDNISELYAGAIPSQSMVGDDAKTIIVSTIPPEGTLSWVWSMFDDPNHDVERTINKARETGFEWWEDSESGWAKVALHWKAHPEYSKNEHYLIDVKRKLKLTDEQLGREYDLVLPQGGGLLFNRDCVTACATGAWGTPIKGHKYLVGIDPSFGGHDYFVLQVWDLTEFPHSLVFEYREHERSNTHYETIAIAILEQWNPNLVAVESNSGGIVVLERLLLACPSIRFERVNTTGASKIPNTDRIALAIEKGEVRFPEDWVGIKEMRTFSSVSRSAVAPATDDSILAFAHAWVWKDECLQLNSFDAMFSSETDERSGTSSNDPLLSYLIRQKESVGSSDDYDLFS